MTVTNNAANRQPEDLLLFGGPTIFIYPSLALALGLNAAIVLYQLDALLEDVPEAEDGRKWYKQNYDGWQTHFPFWSTKTISRIFLKLEEEGYVLSTIKFNEHRTDKTKWYTVDFEKVNALISKGKLDSGD